MMRIERCVGVVGVDCSEGGKERRIQQGRRERRCDNC